MRTVGVEEELLLLDHASGEPKALATAVVARAARDSAQSPGSDGDGGQDAEDETFEKELHAHQIEFATQPQSDMGRLAAEIVRWRAEAARHAGDLGASVAALATSPLPASPSVNVGGRYQWMEEQFGLTTQEQLTCGCHVHVSVESDEEGVAVVDRIRPWLAVLVALSANSPFWQGKDSQYASYRSRVWGRWPMAGPTEVFGSAERYEQQVSDMVSTGVLHDRGMVYFDARLSHRYPTVEIRVADVCLDASTTVLIATLARALVETAAREWRAGRPPVGHGVSLLRLAAWRAARSGLDDVLLHPLTMRPTPSDEVVHALLDHVSEALEDSGDLAAAREQTARLLKQGTGARFQRDLLEKTGSLSAVVAECVRRTQA
ncbi:putative glutamate--cysteine ligase 2 [Streptomyces longispororuber]|uniref:Putative glutamate--cysteine ligase 2 n=1 Tax=Streptomyces longispororuber TaxID=68230 RepID=A0A918ZTD9_9ACTN|nr:glutamate--cysteine ligase [Streptomyces longispororuber]GHE69124.1 putative glutamate--cysteine ligase 2 [Streptomyces longispororuber]